MPSSNAEALVLLVQPNTNGLNFINTLGQYVHVCKKTEVKLKHYTDSGVAAISKAYHMLLRE